MKQLCQQISSQDCADKDALLKELEVVKKQRDDLLNLNGQFAEFAKRQGWRHVLIDGFYALRESISSEGAKKHSVNFSMDGFRRQLSENVGGLRDAIKDIISDGYDIEPSELADLMNAVICDSNVINCVFMDDVKSFSDLSDVELELIELESL
ncbi:hypothetical protein CGT72_10075 [Vibrio cholerae]|uniref:hypothetical protein n=1 Tax=Vibrio cholerae TaxID=666 RepID=UPI000BA9A522|nr:hypothetical protein [Vibrio cholerae]PAS33403.1 hypothetical protein CGT72_10075 [Vibrio cholerae]